MFRPLHDHHQAFLRIKLIDAGYMLGSQLCLQYMFRSLHDHHQAFLRIKSIVAGYMSGSQLCLQLKQVYFV